jgi:asparagine synthase (glutamine-hydrolysing)
MKHVPYVYTPYLDHDLYDFLMGMPATVMSPDLAAGDKSFHTDAIHRAFPQLAHVPFENKLAPKLDARAHHRRFAAEAGRFLVQHPHAGAGLLNRAYVLPRALCAATNGSFGETRPWFASLTLYLRQLELAKARRIPSSLDVANLQAGLTP